jgi:hypothetical protein
MKLKTQRYADYNSSLKTRQLQVIADLNHQRRTIKTAKPKVSLAEAISADEDSFKRRYDPVTRKYSHKLLGEVNLQAFVFNVAGDSRGRLASIKSQPKLSKLAPSAIEAFQKLKGEERKTAWTTDRKHMMLSSIKHFRALDVDIGGLDNPDEMSSKQPFRLKASRDFLNVCKEGDLIKAAAMLKDNQWLAHCKDRTSQSPLHWAARRSHPEMTKLLLENGSFVNSRDTVSCT